MVRCSLPNGFKKWFCIFYHFMVLQISCCSSQACAVTTDPDSVDGGFGFERTGIEGNGIR